MRESGDTRASALLVPLPGRRAWAPRRRATPPPARLLAAGAVLLALVVALVVGPVLVVAGVGVVLIGLLLLANAKWAAAAVVAIVIVCENDEQWGVPLMARAYTGIVRDFSIVDLLLWTATAGTLLIAVRRRDLRLPTPFALPLGFMALAFLAGLLNGRFGGDSQAFQVLGTTLSYTPLFLMPLILINVVEPGTDLRRAIGGLAALTVVKAAAGLFVVYAGIAIATGPDLPALTFYEPTTNLCMLVLLLGVAAARLGRLPVPRFVDPLAVMVGVSLLLSYRRTYWLAALLSLGIVVVIATPRTTRRLIVPALLVVALAGFLVIRGGIGGDVSGPLATRIESISPAKVSRNDQDRYRLAERRDVVAEIKRRPLTGIGVGVAWKTRYPVNIYTRFLDYYTHTAVLWQWLRNGLLGAITYVWLFVVAVVCGVRVWRRHPDGLVRAYGLAAGIGFVGLAVVELASTVIGPDVRGTLVAGTLLGLLAVAHRDVARPVEGPAPPMVRPR